MKWFVIIGVLAVLLVGYRIYLDAVANPRVAEELRNSPDGARAARAMLLTFPDGREIPVNYLREGNQVFTAADGRWWRAFQDGGAPVTLLIRGRTMTGHAVLELDDQDYIDDVFSRLRPAASWVPNWLDAKLVVITLDEEPSP
jgi:hypothetical protein